MNPNTGEIVEVQPAFNRYVDGAERNACKRLRKTRLKPKQPRKCR